MADTTRSQPDIASADVAAEVPDNVPLVFALRAPAPASADDRAAWRARLGALSSELYASLPSQGLRVETVTGAPQAGAWADRSTQSADEASSGLPSPDPSSPGLHTPMDSPLAPRALSISKDDVPDIHDLFINDRAPTPSLSGPSFVTGDAAIGVVAKRKDKIRPMGSQMYQVSMAILQRERDYKSVQTHKFYIDTGSDDTFGFGERLLELGAPNKKGDMDLEVRSHWSQDNIGGTPLHTFLRHGFDPSLSNHELRRQGLTIGRIHYTDGALAHLGLLEPRTCVLYCYDPDQKRPYEIYLTWRFGVAFAINLGLLYDHTSGMLGLGLTGIQHAYKCHSHDTVTPPSFLQVLQSQLKPIPAPRSGEDIAIFFCLRLAPDCYPNGLPGRYPIQSWMSFNVWPCETQPAWNTAKIVVCNSQPHRRRWAVYLRSIKFILVDASHQRRPLEQNKAATYSYVKDSSLDFVDSSRPRGLLVDLDTGSSVTYLPLAAVQRMNEKMFLNDEGTVDDIKGSEQRTYEVNPDSWIFKSTWTIQVVYEFEGVQGSDPVLVHGPFETFAYQRNPIHPNNLEGLVFSSEASSPTDRGTLGLNFFQTMYVSLHKSTDGLDFVRMAGQWPEDFAVDLEKYFVAGVSSL